MLGSLVEKEITTPEYYPLSLNALTTACNQKSNRDPVVSYDEAAVVDAIDSLKDKDLIILERGRVVKYDNYFADKFNLKAPETAIMCELMLRGAQTLGELRTRAERMHPFANLEEVEAILDGLAAREEDALVVKLPRQPGQKEGRYMHLLASDIETPSTGMADGNLEDRVAHLEQELAAIRQEFADFRKQFE